MRLVIPGAGFFELRCIAEDDGLQCELPSGGYGRFGWGPGGVCVFGSDQPPALDPTDGIVIVGEKWIVSMLAPEWAAAVLEGSMTFMLEGEMVYQLCNRHQLSKSK
jgi:hypothetical protein